jgi:hypothetical protein
MAYAYTDGKKARTYPSNPYSTASPSEALQSFVEPEPPCARDDFSASLQGLKKRIKGGSQPLAFAP